MKYVYFFPLTANGCAKIEKSFETEESLRKRVEHDVPANVAAVEYLIRANTVGFFVELDTGEVVMQQSE
jgi:hypothetical protein